MIRHLTTLATLLLLAALTGCASNRNAVRGDQAVADTSLARQENDRAFDLIRQDKINEAEQSLRRAIAADVMFGPARNNLGLVYYKQGKLYEAAHEFQYAIKLMPHHPDPRNNLGLVFEAAGQFIEAKLSDAVAAYEEARRIEPDNPEYLANLARARIRRGDRDETTQKLLEELAFKDSRPNWRDWARMNLLRLRSADRPPTATTQPAAR
jgi:Flp pilus assembly protein TadD